ncbi:uncharacterized protein LOC119258496 [Talpa occidentalis]|uniref:uncharacterized protein LOC119258496 n=1 Tax=Talpa occidentalis TaxID=50954 RepID=UPI00188E29AB|nr:uncharacterized protein LOC119258496 [Talpa occidentalis]
MYDYRVNRDAQAFVPLAFVAIICCLECRRRLGAWAGVRMPNGGHLECGVGMQVREQLRTLQQSAVESPREPQHSLRRLRGLPAAYPPSPPACPAPGYLYKRCRKIKSLKNPLRAPRPSFTGSALLPACTRSGLDLQDDLMQTALQMDKAGGAMAAQVTRVRIFEKSWRCIRSTGARKRRCNKKLMPRPESPEWMLSSRWMLQKADAVIPRLQWCERHGDYISGGVLYSPSTGKHGNQWSSHPCLKKPCPLFCLHIILN